MSEHVGRHGPPNTMISPLRGVDLISTFSAAKILFPNEVITKTHVRFVQRLCQFGEIEAYKLGRKYRIVKRSVYEYIEDHHYRTARSIAD